MDYPPTRSRDYLSVLNSRNLCKKIKKITLKAFSNPLVGNWSKQWWWWWWQSFSQQLSQSPGTSYLPKETSCLFQKWFPDGVAGDVQAAGRAIAQVPPEERCGSCRHMPSLLFPMPVHRRKTNSSADLCFGHVKSTVNATNWSADPESESGLEEPQKPRQSKHRMETLRTLSI